MIIDAPSRSSLELFRAQSGDKRVSLLGAIDRTVTGPGARELAARLSSPLRDPESIAARLDAVSFLHQAETLRDELRHALSPHRTLRVPCRAWPFSAEVHAISPPYARACRSAAICAHCCVRRPAPMGLPAILIAVVGRLTGCPSELI